MGKLDRTADDGSEVFQLAKPPALPMLGHV